MWRTRVGYAGGTRPDPTYRRLGDHTESLQVDFDPQIVSYADLLAVFWRAHEPTRPAFSRQYMSAVFWHDPRQRRIAERTREEQAARRATIHTRIAALGRFYRAEDYHQKYYLRSRRELLAEMRAHYPDARDLTDSTAAARLNGYLGGHGTRAQLAKEIDRLGLTPAGRQRLLALVQGNRM